MGFIPFGRGIDPEAELTRTYKISDMDSQGNPSATKPHYFGYVNKDGQWYIAKITDTTARYARGELNYEANWANRASLTYENFENIF